MNGAPLAAALARVRAALTRPAGGAASLPEVPDLGDSGLGRACDLFDLSPFERDVLVLCAGMELEGDFGALCSAAHGENGHPYPTLALALAFLDGAHWAALAPNAALRHWRLIEIKEGSTITGSPVRIDERILHLLIGLDDDLADAASGLERLPPNRPLVASEEATAERMARLWREYDGCAPLPILSLMGAKEPALRSIAAHAAWNAGMRCLTLHASSVPTVPADLGPFVRIVEREMLISGGVLLFECEASEEALAANFLSRVKGPVVALGGGDRIVRSRPIVRIEAAKPDAAEQVLVWRSLLGLGEDEAHDDLQALIGQFDLGHDEIETAATAASREGDPAERVAHAWRVCRDQSRGSLEALAQRITTAAEWDDLILPPSQIAQLREIAQHVRHRAQVYEEWGFGGKTSRGLGISALFWGASGTGKTMAAEVLGRSLDLDLFRIDLSSMVSKYIGETEKNMKRVFDAAEESGAILLFDEADALFGKRSEVKDSHDRFANIEVGYLLQRIEAYRGLAVLTTNLRDSLDPAFARRIRFSLQFPFPDAAGRAEIWRRAFPERSPTDGLDYDKMAQLNVAGGNIRSIALQAAFYAANESKPVRMGHVLRAARFEYEKLGRPLGEKELRGWE